MPLEQWVGILREDEGSFELSFAACDKHTFGPGFHCENAEIVKNSTRNRFIVEGLDLEWARVSGVDGLKHPTGVPYNIDDAYDILGENHPLSN